MPGSLLDSLLSVGAPKTFSMGLLLEDDRPGGPRPRNPDEGAPTSPFPEPGPTNAGPNTTYDAQRIVDAMRWTLDRESRARLKHEHSWMRSWELYNGRYVFFSKKAAWQSKKSLPRVFSAVHRIGAMLTQYINTTTNWFSMMAGGDVEQVHLDFVKEQISWILDHPDVNWDLIFSDAISVGCLSQLMPIMVTMQDSVTTPTLKQYDAGRGTPTGIAATNGFMQSLLQPKSSLPDSVSIRNINGRTLPRIELCDPFRVYKDSTGRNRYIERTYRYTRGEFRAEAARVRFSYQEEVLASAESRNATMEDPLIDEVEMRNKDNLQSVIMDERDFVHLQCHWGDLYDQHGERIFQDSYAVVANQRYLVYGPVPITDAHGRPPLLAPSLVRVPGSPYGKSLIGVSNDSVELFVEFTNLLVDYFQKMVLGMVEIDEHLLENDSNPRVIFPGKVFVRSPDADPTQPTIRPISFPEPSVQLWQFLGQIQQEINDGTAMASGQTGQQRTRGRVSAMEYSRRAADSGTMINYVFKTIEQTLLEPLLYMIYMNFLQYTPQDEWDRIVMTRAKRIDGTDGDVLMQLLGRSPQWRVQNLGYATRFKVRVFSAISDRQAELEKVTIILNMLKSVPVAMGHVKWWPLLRRLFEALGWDPEEYISKGPAYPQDQLNPAMMAQWAQQLEQMTQALKGMLDQTPGQGAPPVGPGGAGTGNTSPVGSTPSNVSGIPPGLAGGGQSLPGGAPNPLAALLGATAAGAGGGPMTQTPPTPTLGQLAGGQ